MALAPSAFFRGGPGNFSRASRANSPKTQILFRTRQILAPLKNPVSPPAYSKKKEKMHHLLHGTWITTKNL